MAVTQCRIRRVGRSAEFKTPNKNSYVVQYDITTDNPNDWMPVVKVHAQVAGAPDLLPFEDALFSVGGTTDFSAYCNSIQLAQSDVEPTEWIATCRFGPLPPNKTPMDNTHNPLDRPVKYWLEFQEELKPVAMDKDGKEIRNSAGQEFIDPIMMEQTYPVLVAQKNIGNLQTLIDQNIEFRQSVNSSEFFGGEPRTVRFIPIQTGQPQWENEIQFYAAQYRFAYDSETWDIPVVDQGFYYRNTEGKLVRDRDDEGNDKVEPTLLDGAGGKLGAGEPGVVKKFRVRPEKDLNDLL